MANKSYVILTSFRDVLYRIEAWSTNYYYVRSYYDQYVEKYPDSILIEYEVNDKFKATSLVRMLGLDYGVVGLEDFVTSELKMCTSLDNKISVIYKTAYDCSFKTKSAYIEPWLYDEISDIMAGVFLSSAPLVKFIYSDIDLLELLFKAFSYSSKASKNIELDLLYVWRLILHMSNSRFTRYNLISDHHQKLIPVNSVFIENN